MYKAQAANYLWLLTVGSKLPHILQKAIWLPRPRPQRDDLWTVAVYDVSLCNRGRWKSNSLPLNTYKLWQEQNFRMLWKILGISYKISYLWKTNGIYDILKPHTTSFAHRKQLQSLHIILTTEQQLVQYNSIHEQHSALVPSHICQYSVQLCIKLCKNT